MAAARRCGDGRAVTNPVRGPSYCADCSGCAAKCATPGWRGRARRLPPSNASRNSMPLHPKGSALPGSPKGLRYRQP